MTRKIFRSTLFVALVVLLCSLGVVIGFLYRYFDGVLAEQLSDELDLAATGVTYEGAAYLESVESDRFRLTWIDPEGKVLYDTFVPAQDMENHADREEFREASQNSRGSATRYSNTLTEKTVYVARKLSDGTVLRISASQASSGALVIGMLYPILAVLILAVILSALLSKRMARRIVRPLNGLDLDHPLENACYEELSPLLHRIDQQHRQIKEQLQTLRRKTSEFQQITHSMQEGLVLLDGKGQVLSINPAAQALFGDGNTCVGKAFGSLAWDEKMEQALQLALERGHSSVSRYRNGRQYQLDLSSINADTGALGAVVLVLDVTERHNAERTRREFSANVSHELKTPLQAIIGSAELLENGLVKPEDTSRFIGHIRKEAVRLIALIEDIIRLSALDEEAELPVEEVDLLDLAEEVKQQTQTAAEQKNVTVWVYGESCRVTGVRGLLYEMVYNLCDNAIKYNVSGGNVKLHTCVQNGHCVLTVSDTGIGIPEEYRDRVFERFFRVDKSHSRQTGGTGLGLSIVKHTAQYHKAELSLESAPGKGTTVTVIF